MDEYGKSESRIHLFVFLGWTDRKYLNRYYTSANTAVMAVRPEIVLTSYFTVLKANFLFLARSSFMNVIGYLYFLKSTRP